MEEVVFWCEGISCLVMLLLNLPLVGKLFLENLIWSLLDFSFVKSSSLLYVRWFLFAAYIYL